MKNILLISLIILICSCSDVLAQSWQDYDSLRNVYMEKQSYDTALVYAKEVLQIISKEIGDNDSLYANALINVYEPYFLLRNFEKAIEYAEIELKIRRETTDSLSLSLATSCNNLAAIYSETGDFKKAEDLYIEAVEIRKKNKPYYRGRHFC